MTTGRPQCSAQLVISKPGPKEKIEKPSKVAPAYSSPERATLEPESVFEKKAKKPGKDSASSSLKESIEKPSKVKPLFTAPEKTTFEPQSTPGQKAKKFSKDDSLQPAIRPKPSAYQETSYADANGAVRKKTPVDIPPGKKRQVLELEKSLGAKPKFLKEMKGGRV